MVNEFCEKVSEECLCLFECPVGISPLWFSTLCLYYYAHVHQKTGVGASSVKTDNPSNDKDKGDHKQKTSRPTNSKHQGSSNSQAKSGQESRKGKSSQTDKGKQHNKKLNTLGGYAGQVMVDDKRQPICIPAGMSKVVVGRTQDKLPKGSYMVEATDDNNLPCGVSINHTYINPTKAKQVSVILLNTNSYNVWIWQPLYAITIWDVKLKDWDYEPIITKNKDSDMVEIKLQQVPPRDLHEEILNNATETDLETDKTNGKNKFKEKDERPAFDFKKELEWLPFKLNIGDIPLTREQQACLIDIIYDHTEVFLLLTWDSAMFSSIVFQQQWTSQFIFLTTKYRSSYNLRSENILTTG